MKDTEYTKLTEWGNAGGGLVPVNENAEQLLDQLGRGETVAMVCVTARDLKFHKAYMAFLSYIYAYMPKQFKREIPKQFFYQWLKLLKTDYTVVAVMPDGRELIEYKSISFSKMNQQEFKLYVKSQLPFIYGSDVLGKYFDGEIYDAIIENIEEDFKKFLSKL
jgi:hypothetical protein